MKICLCCGTMHGSKKRVCRVCKVPALWRPLTETEQADLDARNERVLVTFNSLVAERENRL